MGQCEKMEQEDNRPKWLLELENRKRKPRLAHEVGAGAPCMTCSSACPGLDLHFWRKICKNCKCSRDDHDVPNDEFPQFNLLFGPSGKPNKKMIVLKVNKKQTEDEVTFEWAPPNTTKELAADYMKALPEDKLPIKGSSGAALRKQQLQRQLPLHDIDHKVCDELSESERKQFEKYLENLKKYVGQGMVMKVMGARPFDRSLMTPANATDMSRFSPKHKQNQPETIHSLNLRTPSSFVPKSFPTSQSISPNQSDSSICNNSPSAIARMENVRSPQMENSHNENSPQGRYHRGLANVRKDGTITSSIPISGIRNPPLNFARMSKINDSSHETITREKESIDERSVPSGTETCFQNKNIPSLEQDSFNPNVPSGTERADQNQRLPTCTQNSSQSAKIPSMNRTVPSGTFEHQSIPSLNFENESVPSQRSIKNQTVHSATQCPIQNSTIPSGTQGSTVPSGSQNPSVPSVKQNSLRNPTVDSGTQYSFENQSVPSGTEQNPTVPSIERASSKNPTVHSGTQYSLENVPLAMENSYQKQNVPSGTQNSALAFAESNMMGNDAEIFNHLGQCEKVGRAENQDNNSASAQNSMLHAPSNDLDDVKSWAHNEDENDEDAVRNFYESLLPPSSINSADIIGSTLDEKGLSFIREKLSSKYSNKNDALAHQSSPMGMRDLGDKKNGAKTKRIDQLKRQGAFDRENDGNETAKNNSSDGTSDKDNDSGINDNEPLGRVMRGICDNYLGKSNDRNGAYFDGNNSDDPTNSLISCRDNLENNSKSLRAEMTNYGPDNTNIIRSESLNNPVFPEHARFSSGLVQNPVSVDRLRGDVEELSIGEKSKTHDCHQCQDPIRAGDVVVTAEKANDAYWHPGCFVCSVCNELLADLVYFYYKGKLYCGRDLATLLEIPRCFACDELIFVREYTVAEGHNYHVKHFCCWDCDVPLAGSQYISENDRPLCLPCYKKTYAKTCRTCEGIIEADQQGVGVKNLNFHANDRCFCCATCKKSLLNGKMAVKENRPFCSKECITKFLNASAN